MKALLSSDEAAGRWIDAMTPLVDPSFQGTIWLPGLAPVTFLGLDGLLAVWRRWLTKWASFRVESEEMIDAGEHVVAVDRGYGRREPDAPEEPLRRTCSGQCATVASCTPTSTSRIPRRSSWLD